MAKKDWMKSIEPGRGGDFGGGGATGEWTDINVNYSNEGRNYSTALNNPNYSNEARNYINPNQTNSLGAGRGHINPASVTPDNAYAYDANNTVASDAASSGYKLNTAFQPNILDNYDVATYHLKLFIVDPDSASNGDILNLANQTIIAESGVSDLTIDKVEIRGITTPSVDGGTGMSTGVKFEVVEPSGAGLIDQIFYQSIALGIGNWTVMPIYLQLQFRGRDPESSESFENGVPGGLGTLKWIWALKITSIKANVTTVGTRYEFEAIVYNELAQSNAYFVLQHNISLENMSTVGSALSELQDKLNLDQMLRLIDNYSIPDTYEIVVDPKISGYNVTPVNSNTNSVKSNSMDVVDLKNGHFSSGTAIDKIIDTLLAQTSEYQKSMLGAQTPGADGASMTAEPSQMKKFWRIITETRPMKFDPRRQDDSRKFTIYIVQYDIGILDSNATQTATPPITKEAERKRLMTYIDKRILKKKYNYIFTGLNDQIINFDLTVNNAFAVARSRLSGIYNNIAMVSKGVVTHDHSKDESTVTEKLSAAISFMSSAKSSNSAAAKAASVDAKAAIAASDLSEETKAKYTTLLEQARPENRVNFSKDVIASGGINQSGGMNAAFRAKNLAKPITETVTGQQLRFISDVNINDPATLDIYKQYMEYAKGKLRPIAFVEQMHDRDIGQGIESNSNSGIQKLSSMFSVAMHSGLDSSFQQIKLTIKGDPFWLFPQPIDEDSKRPYYNSLKPPEEAIEWIKNAHMNASGDAANYYGTDNFLIVRFRTPRIYDIDENPAETDPFTEVATFSGVYKVVSVVSKFEVGKFVQELTCNLDPEINLINFSNEIEANAATNDIPTKPSDLVSSKNIPLPAIKTQKLMGQLNNTPQGIERRIDNASAAVASIVTQYDQLGNSIG